MEDGNQSAIPSSKPTMDQLEKESGITWEDALVRLKGLETSLKHQIQTDIREMKLCMSSNKIEDVSLKAARLHDIRRTLASSRALVREECAIMKEFEKIKGILGDSRTMDEDDWSSTKDQTRYWGDKLAEVRRRQRRVSGDVEGLDGVVSDIISRGSMKSDSMDSLDNLSFHLTNYPLFNNAPYGHHLSVPSRPGSAMSDVSAVSTGIAGYFKGRDTTTDFSQSEAESSITPQTQRKKLFTRTSKKEPSIDGSECEESQYSMQEIYLMEKRKSTKEFKRKAMSEKEANIKALGDHEEALSEYENYEDEEEYFSIQDRLPAEQIKIESCNEELGLKEEKELNSEIGKNQDELEPKIKEENERIEALRLKEEEQFIKIEAAEKLKAEEEEMMRIESQRLNDEQKEKEKIEAQKKKEAEEKQNKVEEKRRKEGEKKKKLEEKTQKEEEKKRKMQLKQKKEEEKKMKLELKQKKEEEMENTLEKKQKKMEEKEKLRLITESKKMEEEEESKLEIKEENLKEKEKLLIQEQQKIEEVNEGDQSRNEIDQKGKMDLKEDNTTGSEVVKPKRSKSRELKEKRATEREYSQSRSQSQDRKSTHSNQDEVFAVPEKNETDEEDVTQSTKEPFILNKKTTKSRSQSQDRKLVQSKQEEASPESIQMDEENNPLSFDGQSKPKKNPIKSRSHSRDRKYEPSNKEEAPVESTQIEMDEVNATQSTQEQSKTKIKPTKSQSRDWKSVQSKLEEPSFESTQIEINEDDITQSFEELSIAKKKTIQSPPQSQDRKSVPSNKEEVLFKSTQIDMNEVDVKQSTKEPSMAKKKKIKSRSQSRDRKFSQTKQKEVPANSTQIETGEVDVIPLKEVLADQQNGKMTKQGSIINKEFKTLKSQPQSRENSIKQPENKNDLLEDNGNTLFPNENRATAIESSQKPEDPSKTKIIKSRSQSREKKSIGVEELKTGLSTKQVEYNNENNIEASLVENELGDGCQVANPRRSKGKLAEKPTLSYVDPENQDQELQTEGFSKLQTVKSRSQSREKKYIAIEEDDISLSTKQAENNNENDIEASQVEKELGDGSQVAKPRRSKGKLAKQPTLSYGDPENQDQELQTEGFSKLQSAKSRSQSREKKYIAIQEDNISLSTKQAKYNNEASEVEHELSNLPQVAKPRRRKGKSAEHPTLSSCETKNEEQRIITEGDSKSQSVKSRSQSREKKSIAIEEDDISLSTKQAEYNNENDFQASHVRNELDDGPQIPKPRRSKGKLGKQPTVSTETSENINQSQFIESNSQRMDIVQMESLYPKGAYVEDGSYNEGQEGTKFCNSPRSISRDRSQIYAEEAESELLKGQFFEAFEIEDLTLTNTQVVKPRRSKVTNKKSAEPPENCVKSRSTSRNMNPLSIRDVFVISLDKDNECDANIILNSNFKQNSPEYAEIDYEQDQLMTGEKNLGQYGMEEQIMGTTNVECQYATVQKKKKGSRNGSQDRQDDSNAPIQEPIYAEVQKKTSSRPTSLDRNNSREEGLQEFSFRTSSMDQRSFQDSSYMEEKKTPSSSRQASRERKNSEGQRSLSGERGNITEFESKGKTPSSESLKKPVRSSRMKNNEELNLNDSNSENICNVFESMGKIKSDFLGHEDPHESSSELPDMVPIKKPERSSRNHVLDIGYLKEDEYPLEIVHTGTKPSLKGQKYSINNQDSLDFEEFEDTNEYLQDIDYELRSAELAEEEELNSLRRTKEIKSYLPPGNSDTRDNLYIDEEMERPLSALGTYSADDEPEDSVDELISYQERNFIREKPDGMDKEELRQFDPRAFQQRKRQKSGLLSPDSSFEDEEYFHNLNQGLKSGKKEPENTQSRLTQSRNLARERPMKLDLSDLKPRLGEKVKGNFYQDEALMDELDLRNSLNQMWHKEPGRRRRTVSHSFQSEDNDYIVGDDVVEFDSGINNYPFLKPPPRKSRSRSVSVSPLPKEKENIGPKLERMFSNDQDLMEIEYDDNGVKKMKKVSFATENEKFVLRPDPEVRSIPGTRLFTFSPSKTHEQPPDSRQRGRQNKKSTTKTRSSSADVSLTWSKNSAIHFLKSMANLSKGSKIKADSNGTDIAPKCTDSEASSKFDDVFAAAPSELSFNTNELINEVESRSYMQSSSLNRYFDKLKMNQSLSASPKTTQSLDNVNLQKTLLSHETLCRPYSTESPSITESNKNDHKKQTSSLFGSIIHRAKSLSRGNSRQNSEERSIFKNLFQPKSINKNSDVIPPSQHKRSLSFDGFARKLSGGSNTVKTGGAPSNISTEENFNDGPETEFLTESEASLKNRLKTKKGCKASVNKTDFDKLFARGIALSTEKDLVTLEPTSTTTTTTAASLLDIDHRPTTPFEVFSKDEVFKKSQQGAGISFEEKVKYFLDDLSHQPHTSNFRAPMNCSPVAAAAAVAAMAPPRTTISPGMKKRGAPLLYKEEPKPESKESPHQFLRRAEEFVKLAEVDSEYSQPVWPAIVQSPEDLPPPKPITLHSNVPVRPKSPLYPNFTNLVPALNSQPAPPSPSSENVLSKSSIPVEVSQALAPMMAVMMEMKKSSKSPEPRTGSLKVNSLTISGVPKAVAGTRQRSASSLDPFHGSYKTDLGRAEYGTLTRNDMKSNKGRASSVSNRLPSRDNSLDRINKLRRSTSKDSEINHRRRSQEPLILDPTRSDSRISNYSADVPDLEDADISNAMLKSSLNFGKSREGEFLQPSSNILETKERVLDQMEKEKLALQEAKSWFQTVLMIILCVCAIIFIQNEKRL